MSDLMPKAKHIRLFSLPVWAGLLAWPFTGAGRAFWIAAVALAAVLFRFLTKTLYAEGLFALPAESAGRFRRLLDLAASAAKSRISLALFIAALVIIPFYTNDYYRDVLTLTGMYVVLALGLNIIVGQAGLLNLGYVSFYAVGAYTYAVLSTRYGLSFWPGLVVGALSASGFAALIGGATLRLRGDYFAIVTLGLGEITYLVLKNWDAVTNGPNGISGIGRPSVAGHALSEPLAFYYLILVMAVITVFAVQRLMNSRVGRAWAAIREDELAAEAMGINTFRMKLLAFTIGSSFAGMAGVFFAAKMAFVSPESFTFMESVMILCMVVLGGMGSIPGIVLGAFLLIALPEFFRDFQDYRMLAFGGALVAMMIFRPQGLLGSRK